MTLCGTFHNHTCFGDGADTPQRMVEAAARAGFQFFGLSEHAPAPLDPAGGMRMADLPRYIDCVRALKKQFSGKVQVLLGLEQDIDSPQPDYTAFDYIIGSVHGVRCGDAYYCVDESPASFQRGIDEGFGGDVYAFAEAYYDRMTQVAAKTKCDIVAHFDLFCKFNGDGAFFDEAHPRYRAAAQMAIDALCAQGALIEINTGAMSRGYRRRPYPDAWMLRAFCRGGASIVFGADAHRTQDICTGLQEAALLAHDCGFTRAAVWQNGKIVLRPL